jgi:large subunit ribosomal protein L20
MARIKRGIQVKKTHRKTLRLARSYWGGNSRLYRSAKEAVMHAQKYSYRDRRNRKRDFRRLWIARISAACRAEGLRYSEFICGMNRAKICLDRKVLAELAVNNPLAFSQVLSQARAALAG